MKLIDTVHNRWLLLQTSYWNSVYVQEKDFDIFSLNFINRGSLIEILASNTDQRKITFLLQVSKMWENRRAPGPACMLWMYRGSTSSENRIQSICSLGSRVWVPWPTRLALSPSGQGIEPCSLFSSQAHIVVSPDCLSDTLWNGKGHFQGIWCRNTTNDPCKALPAFIPACGHPSGLCWCLHPAHQALVHKELLYIQPRAFSILGGSLWQLQMLLAQDGIYKQFWWGGFL